MPTAGPPPPPVMLPPSATRPPASSRRTPPAHRLRGEARSPLDAIGFRRADPRGDDHRALVAVQSPQRQPPAHRVSEEHVAARRDRVERRRLDLEAGVAQKIPIARQSEEAVEASD